MSTGSSKLATGGNVVKVWNDLVLQEQFSSHTSPVSNVTWSPDGHFLASSSVDGSTVTVSHVKCLKATTDLKENAMQCTVCFGNTSARLVTCGKQPHIFLWDLKTRKVQKTLNSSLDSVNCIGFNKNDTHIACGSLKGQLVLVNLVSGVCNTPMTTSSTKTIRSLSFHNFQKSILGTASDDGRVALWDVNRSVCKRDFKSHSAPATGFVFSSKNNSLAISVGLDKSIVYYDIENKKIIQKSTVDAPLTCVDLSDGVNVAVGTMKGTVLIYDLRVASNPLHTIFAYSSSVNCLQYQKEAALQEDDFPWIDQNISLYETMTTERSELKNKARSKKKSLDKHTIFSPLHDSRLDLDLRESDLSPLSSLAASTDCQQNGEVEPAATVEGYEFNCASTYTPVNHPMSLKESLMCVPEQEQIGDGIPSENAQALHKSSPESSASHASPVSSTIQTFNANLLKSIVTDARDYVAETLHKDILNLQVDMLKRFQVQQMQIETLFRQYSINEELVAEIERLREENKRLRLNY